MAHHVDIDALIDDLQSLDGHDGAEEEEEEEEGGEDSNRSTRCMNDELLQTNTGIGLSVAEVELRRKKYGPNQMQEEKRSSLLKFLKFFTGPIPLVMEATCVLAAILKDWVTFAVICTLMLLNAVVGFVQEHKAGNIVDELKKTLALKARVLRDGKLTEYDVSELVPGDLILLEEGAIIPADGFIVSKKDSLQVEQSSITGESLAVGKSFGEHCFSSSSVKRGTAYMVVSETGDETYVGRAAALVNAAHATTGRFREVLDRVGSTLLALVIYTLLPIWVGSFYRGNGIVEIASETLAIVIIAVPVGLPAVVTTTMAVGAGYLAKKKAIVQNLSAIESLAGVEVLCSDKTGTLTKNKLSLSEPFTVSGVHPDELMLTACLAASLSRKGMEPIDKAFIKALKSYPKVKLMLPECKIIEFCPFDPVSKKVTAIVEFLDGTRMTCVKGSPLAVLKTVEDDHPVPENIGIAYQEKVAEFASRGFRSLGVARKRDGFPWEILGITPCFDPPRHDTAQTIRRAHELGLKVKMLTGDAVGIARETSRQLGLGTNIYDAGSLGGCSGADVFDSDFYDFVAAADGFAEVFPEHKYNVVDVLQRHGKLVAMTGDGVNDAPSLKKADTGIAVEGSSNAARSAADIIFLAPGLSAIIDAIKTARQIFHRMCSYMVYRIALSLHLEIFLGLWILIRNRYLALDLLVFVAIFADLATLAIAYDNAPCNRAPVKWNMPRLWCTAVVHGIILALGSGIMLHILQSQGNANGIIQRYGDLDAILFLEIVLTENWLIFITRAKGPFWSSWPSYQLSAAVLIVDIIASIMCSYGTFVDSRTDIVTICCVWLYSFGIFSIMAGCHTLLQF